jgi:ankyrin repeat protein
MTQGGRIVTTRQTEQLPPHKASYLSITGYIYSEDMMQTESGAAHADNANAAGANGKSVDQETLNFIRGVFAMVREGDADSLRALVEKGLPVNFRNEKGDSLIMLASYHGHLETVRVLLDAGANPNVANDQGQTPLAGVAYKGFLPIAELLLKHGARIEGASPDGKTPLMMAAMFNRPAIVELFLAHGARLDAVDSRGMTAITLAQSMGAADTLAQLQNLQQ